MIDPQNLNDVRSELLESGGLYREFLRVPDLSVGLYRLEAGSEDPQNPHQQDEVYYVLSGRAKIRVGERVLGVKPKDVIHVEKNVEHKFFDIESDLELLVFFAPAET